MGVTVGEQSWEIARSGQLLLALSIMASTCNVDDDANAMPPPPVPVPSKSADVKILQPEFEALAEYLRV
jgi:hypothetical protein